MKLKTALSLAAAAFALAACSEPAAPVPVVDDSGCVKPESGVIRPQSPGVQSEPLRGPFLVKSLSVGVDPANPQFFGSLMWSRTQVWLTVHDFKGPFYLAPEEMLTATEGRSPYVTIYSGCRLD